MARLPRLYAPRIPQLAQVGFAQALSAPPEPVPAAELSRIRDWLREEAARHGLAVHAWLITPDRICLLGTPAAFYSVSRVIQGLGRRMGASMLHGRAYEGRYRNALLEPGRWVLPAMVWLEHLPVTLGYVDHASRWPWSSAAGHIGMQPDPLLNDHTDYWNEGNTPFSRQAHYRQRLETGLGAAQCGQIEAAIFGQWALGERIFLTHLGRLASRRVVPATRGRPRRGSLS
jgi:putative transposase